MKLNILSTVVAAILGFALISAPVSLHAADTTATAPAKTAKAKNPQYHGILKAVDTTANTITVDISTKKEANKTIDLTIAATTKIKKDGKVSTLGEFTVGDKVGGSYVTDATGKNTAVTLTTKAAKK